MKRMTLMLAAIVGFIGAPCAFAADAPDVGFYVLGGVGRTFSNDDQQSLDNALRSVGATGFASSTSNPTVYKLQLGYQFMKNVAVEGGYLGSTNETYNASGGNLAGPVSASVNAKGWNVNAVGILPVAPQFSLLGKLGLANLRSSATVVGPGGAASTSGSKTDLTYGIGAKYDINNNIFVRLDVDRYTTGTSSHTNLWMLDLGYKF